MTVACILSRRIGGAIDEPGRADAERLMNPVHSADEEMVNRVTSRVGFGVGIIALVAGSRWLYSDVVSPARYGVSDSPHPAWWIAFGSLLIVSTYGVGLPELPDGRIEALWRSGAAVILSLLGVSMLQLATASPLIPRSSLALVGVLVPLWSLLAWNVSADLRKWVQQRDRILVVSARPEEVAALRSELERHPEVPASVVGEMSVIEARVGPSGQLPLMDVANELRPTVIVLDKAAQSDDSVVEQVRRQHELGVRVRTMALFYEGWLGKIPVAELAQVSLLFDVGELHRARYARAKRILDLAVGLVGTAIFGLIVPVVAVCNLVANRGPLFFRQTRVGKGGELFDMLKFRTMTSGTNSSEWTASDDARITPFGGLMRKLHLDELPQMVNIVRGELSIVGPRPEQPAYVLELTQKIPFYPTRHIARPGLTGWAQVKYGYAASESDALEKLQYDFYYLRRQNILLDLQIMSRTLREVVGGLGR